jgi:hypothetical protein
MLFIHPSRVNEARLILEAQPLIQRLGAGPAGGKRAAPKKADQPSEQQIPPEPTYAATQVQLVELLQFIRTHSTEQAYRVAVNISAWDIVMGLDTTAPEAWLEKRLPLLHQYLVAHSDKVPFRVYGISAQGGDLKQAEELRAKIKTADRIIVVRGKKQSHDITDPVRWVMGSSADAS